MRYVNRIKIMYISIDYYRSGRLLSINSNYDLLMAVTIDGNHSNAANQSSHKCV